MTERSLPKPSSPLADPYLGPIFLTIQTAQVVCITIGNAIVILVVYRNRHLHTPSYLLLASMAFSDFLMGIVAIPLSLYFNVIAVDLHCNPVSTNLFSTPLAICGSVSFLHIIAVTVDRYIALTRPLQYATLVTNRRVKILLPLFWLSMSLLFSCRSGLMIAYSETMWTFRCEGPKATVDIIHTSNLIIVSILVILYTAVVVFNVRILQLASKQLRIIDAQMRAVVAGGKDELPAQHGLLKAVKTITLIVALFCVCWFPAVLVVILNVTDVAVKQANIIANVRRVIQPDGHNYNRHDGRLKAVKTTSVVVGTFCACWTPTLTYFFLRLTTNMSKEIYVVLVYVSHLVGTISSAVNPLIYGYRNKNFQDAFRKTIRCGLRTVMTED
ncbi:adenosine receptor A3-like [Diadema antillarum]|uniref:adenosine receptor A3-like n=1 Tax=Diadema antillarum TaxID=105358 RepID=UPI003A8A289B